MNIKSRMEKMGKAARAASYQLAKAGTAQKNAALDAIAAAIWREKSALLAANEKDCLAAEVSGIEAALLDRLRLSEKGVDNMAEGVAQIARLPDPVGEITDLKLMPSGIQVGRMRVPLGVIGIIYEARPNVTADAAALCLKSGNAAILRGGSEAIQSNQAIARLVAEGLHTAGLPSACVQIVESTDRAVVGEMITLREYIDVIVPRGGKGLIKRLLAESRVPMIQHLDGNCHVYVESGADVEKAIAIVDNAKTQRYGTCNTAETLLIDEAILESHLPAIAAALIKKGVEIRACEKSRSILKTAIAATDDDYATEFLAPIIAVKVVSNLDAAILHIHRYGSRHTEAIVTENHRQAMRFLREVDSSSVMVNASTRFADGFEYGLGAEIGISTDKIHARGPVGLEGLTSQKWVVLGDGHVRG